MRKPPQRPHIYEPRMIGIGRGGHIRIDVGEPVEKPARPFKKVLKIIKSKIP